MTKKHRYTKEQIDFILEISKGKSVDDIRKIFNEKFSANVTIKSIKGIMYRHQIKNHMQGHSTRFSKGQPSWNKGLKGINTGGEKGWFKKGNLPPSHTPVGSESIKDGYVLIKIDEPNVWKKKHHYLWEQEHESIPKNMVLRFLDGNKLNVTLDNLFLVSRRVCLSVSKRKLDQKHPYLNKTVHNLATLELKIKDIEKNKVGK